MSIYKKALAFKKKYPLTVAWRLKKNCAVIEKHLDFDETVHYVFVGQKNKEFYDLFTTCIVVVTNKRILIGRKRVVFGYALDSIMPYMFNDMNVRTRIIWGTVCIDTVDEDVTISNIDKSAMTEIVSNVNKHMIKLKQLYVDDDK